MSVTTRSSLTVPVNFPVELWDSCFAYLLPVDLVSSTLTCKAFRDVAQRLPFRDLRFTGWRLGQYPTKKEKPKLQAILEGFRALQKSHLREYVQRCTLINWTAGHHDPTAWKMGQGLFEFLSRLPNLHTATCDNVLFKSDDFTKLFGSRNLRTLKLRACMFPFDDTIPYELEEIELSEPVLPSGSARSSFAYAVSQILLPAHLRTLSLVAPVATPQIVSCLVGMGIFERLTVLCITSHPEANIALFLQHCPALRQLDIIASHHTDSKGLTGLSKEAIPRLDSFGGQLQAALSVLENRTVRLLTIHAAVDSKRDLASTMRLVKSTLSTLDKTARNSVENLTVHVPRGTKHDEAPRDMKDVFPKLRHFQAIIVGGGRSGEHPLGQIEYRVNS